MDNGTIRIDLLKLIRYMLIHILLPIILAVAGFAAMYFYTDRTTPYTYTASGTMYVYNANPNTLNYQYTSSTDLDSAVKLIDTYMIVVKSNKVMDVVAERLSKDYSGIMPEFIASTLSMASVSETGVVRVSSTTFDPQLSADIVNAVLDVAPAEIIRVVSAGSVEVIDYALPPVGSDSRNLRQRGMYGAMAGFVLGIVILAVLFLLNRRVTDEKDLTDNYTPPILASIKRIKKSDVKKRGRLRRNDPEAGEGAALFMLTNDSPMEIVEGYAKLRMNLLYSLADKESRSVIITSSFSGEGKTTIAANLAISCARGDKRVLLVDADMRRACQRDVFRYDKRCKGLSEALAGSTDWHQSVLKDTRSGLFILPAGEIPPNPAELLDSPEMRELLNQFEDEYDLVLLDMPPINIVTDSLVLSADVAGCVFVVRQDYSDHRDIRKALIAAEMTDMNVMGFVFFGEKIEEGSNYSRKYYKSYYNKYDYRKNPAVVATTTAEATSAGLNAAGTDAADKKVIEITANSYRSISGTGNKAVQGK